MEAGLDPDTGEGIALADVLAGDAEDPAEAAARNLDWEVMMESLDALEREMIVAFARGDTMRGLKNMAGLSDSGMSGRKRRPPSRVPNRPSRPLRGHSRRRLHVATPRDWAAGMPPLRRSGGIPVPGTRSVLLPRWRRPVIGRPHVTALWRAGQECRPS